MIKPDFYFKASTPQPGGELECVVTYIRAGKFYKTKSTDPFAGVNMAGMNRTIVVKPVDKISESTLVRGLKDDGVHTFMIQHVYEPYVGGPIGDVVRKYFEDRHGSLEYIPGSTKVRVCDVLIAVDSYIYLGVEMLGKDAKITYETEDGKHIAVVEVIKANGELQTVRVPYNP